MFKNFLHGRGKSITISMFSTIVLAILLSVWAIAAEEQIKRFEVTPSKSQQPPLVRGQVSHQIVTIMDIRQVGKVETDLMLKELIFTSYAPSSGGMRISLFGDGTLIRETGSYVYGPKRVTLAPGTFYMVTISRDDKIGVAYFRMLGGHLALKVIE